ncbi:MAG TPA: M48 family metallopeptidase [Jatrophihabitantaceae bacterium]|nr:M48 family metallopeptidase [Jatrophihabitantaceae bacterium]
MAARHPEQLSLGIGAGVDADVDADVGVEVQVEVRRSARRRRTVSAYHDGERIVVLIPGRFTRAEEAEWVAKMVARLDSGKRQAGRKRGTDTALARHAAALSATYLDGGARPASIRWVPTMRTRWASCTPDERSIRISEALRPMPGWVQDYVILHELAHLLVPGHGPRFWALLERYPRTERARGYLDGVASAAHLPIGAECGPEVEAAGNRGDAARSSH